MRVMGHNALAIVVAAIVIFAIGAAIYGFVLSEAWIASTGWSEEEIRTGAAKMPFSAIMPILIAIGLSLAIKWRGRPGWSAGAMTGLLVAVFFLLAQRMYGYVYSPAGGETWLMIDGLYALLSGVIGGAIIGAWK